MARADKNGVSSREASRFRATTHRAPIVLWQRQFAVNSLFCQLGFSPAAVNDSFTVLPLSWRDWGRERRFLSGVGGWG